MLKPLVATGALSVEEMVNRNLSLIKKVREIPGTRDLHGECSWGVSLNLADGTVLEIGITDTDVAATPGELWVSNYIPKNMDRILRAEIASLMRKVESLTKELDNRAGAG